MRRITFILTTLALALMAPQAALAQESGAGQLHVTEKLITEFGLGLVVGFSVFVWLMSRLQGALDKRKDRKKAAHRSAKGAAAWRGGW